ncbi:MAG: hypothetical protein AAGK09_09760 [Planctomycetota bacterium]
MTTAAATPTSPVSADPPGNADGYGRARLWVGISGVGTMVVASTLALTIGLPGAWYGNLTIGTMLGAFFAWLVVYVLLQAPFDWLGGYILPAKFGRPVPALGMWVAGWLRGVIVQAGVLGTIAVALTLAGHFGEWPGTVVLSLGCVVVLLWGRVALAWLVGGVRVGRRRAAEGVGMLAERVGLTEDASYTGGIVGVLRPRTSVLPAGYADALGDEGVDVVRARRAAAVRLGLWWRGRVVAVVFTVVGVALAAALVGDDRLGTAGATVELSLWFTLWSFAGLLVLPTLSRRAVDAIDRSLVAEGRDPESVDRVSRALNARQDGETHRPGLVETIFHPIPSVENRTDRGNTSGRSLIAAWDAARSAVYFSAAGLGLLGRAVHCNAGKPALWVFLPTD